MAGNERKLKLNKNHLKNISTEQIRTVIKYVDVNFNAKITIVTNVLI